MIKKILIANRGEIACRVARTANQMGIRTVAVYSDVDGEALHVNQCDEAVALGGVTATESYLAIDKIIQAAQKTQADAIHPGYGFLSENSEFASRCGAEGIIFIGPSAQAIQSMGSKSAARQAMVSVGVPVLPGYDGDEKDIDLLTREAIDIGFPILIKAVFGGGGKGMRVVESVEMLDSAMAAVKRESFAAFSDDQVLLEKFLPIARHIEVQIFGDQNGNVVHLYERDCSLQRRHQKVIEESPAPGLDGKLRDLMTQAAIRCAQSIGYIGAGTIEFLLAPDNNFYFMEMNARLQVEHPVTELVTGQDLVEWQIRVAQGESLPCAQSQITISGHAMEARIYAENPEQNFLPCSGRLLIVDHPNQNPGIRVDTGVRSGDQISTHYDPMISKLIAWGSDRNVALQKLTSALQAYAILGIKHNVGFLQNLLNHAIVRDQQPDTLFIENNLDTLLDIHEAEVGLTLACGTCYRLLDTQQRRINDQMQLDDAWSPWSLGDGWQNGLSRKVSMQFLMNAESYSVSIEFDNDALILGLPEGSQKLTAKLLDPHHLKIDYNGKSEIATIVRFENEIFIHRNGWHGQLHIVDLYQPELHTEQHDGRIESPMPGSVIVVEVAKNDRVSAGDILVIVEAMKMEHQIRTPIEGFVKSVHCAVGAQIREGDLLMTIE